MSKSVFLCNSKIRSNYNSFEIAMLLLQEPSLTIQSREVGKNNGF